MDTYRQIINRITFKNLPEWLYAVLVFILVCFCMLWALQDAKSGIVYMAITLSVVNTIIIGIGVYFFLDNRKLQKKKKSLSSNRGYKHFRELDFLMKEAKMYRDSCLSLETMSRKLNISSNYLSQLVNKLSGCTFTEYINGFRIEDVKLKLEDPRFVNYTVIAIALEAGFNSKSTFYHAFKKNTGISPRQYRYNNTK